MNYRISGDAFCLMLKTGMILDTVLASDLSAAIFIRFYDMEPLPRAPEERSEIYQDIMRSLFFLKLP